MALEGVHWARVDVVTRAVVVRFDPDDLEVADLVEAVAAAEDAAGITMRGYGHSAESFPDAGPVVMQAGALAVDLVGLSAAVTGWATRLPSLPGSTAAAVVLVDNQPRLRRALEHRMGPAATDLAVTVSNAAVHGCGHPGRPGRRARPGRLPVPVPPATRPAGRRGGGCSCSAGSPWLLLCTSRVGRWRRTAGSNATGPPAAHPGCTPRSTTSANANSVAICPRPLCTP